MVSKDRFPDIMNEEKALELLKKYELGTLSQEEKALLETWYNKTAADSQQQLSPEMLDQSFVSIKSQLPAKPTTVKTLWPRLTAAAVLFIALTSGVYFLLKKPVGEQQDKVALTSILPGGNKAVLTLSDGKQLVLTGVKNGQLKAENNAIVKKTADGSLTYQITAAAQQPDEITYNTLTTPRGGEYQLTLTDGTRVWLNAASSIKYPTAFSGASREVELTGEAYFEVAHYVQKPFRVKSGTQVVEVLGTHFNVNAYHDEQTVKTTLLEGSVKVTPYANGDTQLLKPGQQSSLSPAGIHIESANLEQAVAWKNGYFRFNNEKLEDIMRQLSRWYNIDIEYQGPVTDERFYGTISRFKHINEVLEIIQQTKDVHFKMQGRRIIITG